MESLLIIGYFFILIIVFFIISKNTYQYQENLVNLDESRKIRLKKCCEKDKCYDKPSFLHIYDENGKPLPPNSCEENKKTVESQLDKVYDMMFTNEQYNKLLKEDNIRPDAIPMDQDNTQRIKDLFATERINIDKTIGIDVLNKIMDDNTDSINGKYEL